MTEMDRVLIVGGGIAGLSAAIALRRAGFRAEVFEQAPELREVGAGVGLWSNALDSLDQLGAGKMVRESCRPLRTVAGSNPRGKTLSSFDLDALGPEFATAACSVVLRPVLLAALAGQVPADVLQTGRRVVGIEPGQDRVRVRTEDGAIEECALVVGADGLHSVVRPHVVGQDQVRYSGQTCFRGIAEFRAAEPGIMREVQGRGQRGSVCPVDADTVYWWTALNAPDGKLLPQKERKAFLIERYGGWPFGLPEAIAATPDAAILQQDLVDRPPARTYARGRLVLTGDAAHPTTPNLGQGANMAIDDAIVLARALRAESSIAAALERYQRERLPRTRLIVQRSWSFGRMCLWDSSLAVGLRELMLALTPTRVMKDMLRWQILEGVGSL
jgi:2-polyprenyl-6-methoxyphenol hydroxylase-like FAD-dependent oxidoreductase